MNGQTAARAEVQLQWLARMTEQGEAVLETSPLSEGTLEQIRRSRPARTVCLLVYYGARVEQVPLEPGTPVVIGRDESADVAVPDESLSRRHARFTAENGAVTVDDLGSTNGTWRDGERVSHARLRTGEHVMLGAVHVSTQALPAGDRGAIAVGDDDRFMAALEDEVTRARFFGRRLAVVMVRAAKTPDGHVGRWYPRVRERLRAVDKSAIYSAHEVEVVLAEADVEQAMTFARALAADGAAAPAALACGIAIYPETATNAEELVSAARRAVARTTPAQPIEIAPLQPSRAWTPSDAREAAMSETAEGNGPVIRSEAMREIWATAARLARSAIPVLLVGETGTGKEVVARALHAEGPRHRRPMISVNCAAIPAPLVESTLFGHERGAFTGANQQQRGVFEAAHGGTVLLDEVGELPLAAQAALLRVLETKRVVRLGSTREIDVDVRVLAATHRDLEAMCEAQTFRSDLFFRLNGITLAIPPLRDRPDDVEPLALRFLHEANAANGCEVTSLDGDALAMLLAYSWPGNVRELRNAIERAVVVARGKVVTVADLPDRVRAASRRMPAPATKASEASKPRTGDLRAQLLRYEADAILEALREADWNQTEAARRLGLPLRTLVHKIKSHGLRKLGYGVSSRK